MKTTARLLLHIGFTLVCAVLIVAVGRFTTNAVLHVALPYVLSALFALLCWRLGERQIWLFPLVTLLVCAPFSIPLSRAMHLIVVGLVPRQRLQLIALLALWAVYLLPALLAALLFRLLRRGADRRAAAGQHLD